jgi:hypothetical protein
VGSKMKIGEIEKDEQQQQQQQVIGDHLCHSKM